MAGKIKFVLGTIAMMVLVYFFMTVIWSSVMVPSIDVAYQATDNVSYKYTKAAIGAAPIWLYILPAACALGLIVWKLKQPDEQG